MGVRGFSFRSVLCATVACSLGFATMGQAAAREGVEVPRAPGESRSQPYSFEASPLPDDTWLSLVQEEMAKKPAQAAAIAGKAKQVRPHLSEAIAQLLEQHAPVALEGTGEAIAAADEGVTAGTTSGAASVGGSSTALIAGGLAMATGGALALAASGGGGSGKKSPRQPRTDHLPSQRLKSSKPLSMRPTGVCPLLERLMPTPRVTRVKALGLA